MSDQHDESLIRRLARFVWRVLGDFFGKNKGLLLAGGVGYNALLSLVPLAALVLAGVGFFFDEQRVLSVAEAEIQLLVPGRTETLMRVVRTLLDQRELLSGFSLVFLLFFSSLAFRMLEAALDLVFHRERTRNRSFLMSALLPYLFLIALGVALLALSALTLWVGDAFLRVLGFVGLVVLFSAAYLVLPPIKVDRWRALIGGFVAAVLWEGARELMAWYFTHLSMVDALYGSFATAIVVLLAMELAAGIVLLGAQVIAELERNDRLGVPWYVDPNPFQEPSST